MKSFFKKLLPHIGVVFFFLVLVVIYFQPVFEGKTLPQQDLTQFEGMAQEVLEYGKQTGWTGSMFSGMPTYQITGYSEGIDFVGKIRHCILILMDQNTAGPIFIMLLTAYILFLVFGFNIYIAVLGAIALTFSSYNIIIIEAGHVSKLWALAFVPLVIAGFVMVLKKKYISGFLLFTFGLYFHIASNHFQTTYYLALFLGILFIAFLIYCIRQKEYKHLLSCIGIFACGAILTVGININNLYMTEELGKESIRGKAELTPQTPEEQSAKESHGLDRDYAFAWSYGKAETFTLLIPNLMGGETGGYLDSNSQLYKVAQSHGMNVGKEIQTYTYWGDQPFTSGPVYFGAIVCFLFMLSFFIVPGKTKWWLLGACIFFILLSWGKNFAGFNDFMFYHFPYYSKFRTVSTALIIPGIIFPILAAMGLNQIFKGNITFPEMKKALIGSVSITGGICLILWLIPGAFFNFESPMDAQHGMPDWYMNALIQGREGLLRADALRSLILILLAAALIFVYAQAKDKSKAGKWVLIGLVVLVLFDLWQVDKRYVNDSKFVNKRTYQEQAFKKSVADQIILKDTSPSYRVLNLNNPFQETSTSYYHKSIGGYHAAKLRRYQDLIERRLSKELQIIYKTFQNNPTPESILNAFQQCPSLNMLNTKYVIYNPGQAPLENPYHDGNAWFVDSYKIVDTPDQEMDALETLNPVVEAVISKDFESNLKGLQLTEDSTAIIDMTSYTPNKVTYKCHSSREGLAVFSEVYYPYGWKAYIDGKRVPISRADWVLRALVVPAGDHEIVMEFDHDALKICGIISTISSGLLLVLLLGFVGFVIYRERKKKKE